ncbi:FliM/FliN family flagellar motor C-terminal domain-containing protein [Vibrio astriarenae]
MKKVSLCEFGNPNIKLVRLLLKHVSHFNSEMSDLVSFNFCSKSIKTHIIEAKKPPKGAIVTVLNVEDYGYAYFYIEPSTLDYLLKLHLQSDHIGNSVKSNKNTVLLTRSHHRLFEKLVMALSNIVTADAKHYRVEHTEHIPTDIGFTTVFSLDGSDIKITCMLDSRYVKKLRALIYNPENFSKEDILRVLARQPVDLSCILMQGQMSLFDLSKLSPGDFIPLSACPTVEIGVNGRPIYNGKLQTIQNELGVEIHG